ATHHSLYSGREGEPRLKGHTPVESHDPCGQQGNPPDGETHGPKAHEARVSCSSHQPIPRLDLEQLQPIDHDALREIHYPTNGRPDPRLDPRHGTHRRLHASSMPRSAAKRRRKLQLETSMREPFRLWLPARARQGAEVHYERARTLSKPTLRNYGCGVHSHSDCICEGAGARETRHS